MKDKSKFILIIAILAIAAIIAWIFYGIINGGKNPIATMEVSYVDNDGNTQTGTVKIELDPSVAPESVANFVNLANNGFYDNLTFHRIVSDFMIQGGSSDGTGSGSAKLSDLDKKIQANSSSDYTYSIKGEFANNNINNNLKFEKGVIGMARSDYSSYGLTEEGYNSGSSQFFIVTTDKKETLDSLNYNYASFGKVIEGYEVVEAISNVKVTTEEGSSEASKPENAPIITSIRVDTFGANYKIPETINYDTVLQTVQQYQNYYQQLFNNSNSSTSAETTETSNDEQATE